MPTITPDKIDTKQQNNDALKPPAFPKSISWTRMLQLNNGATPKNEIEVNTLLKYRQELTQLKETVITDKFPTNVNDGQSQDLEDRLDHSFDRPTSSNVVKLRIALT